MEITKANSAEYKVLTDITKQSKAYLGYSNEQIESWSDLLTTTKDYIENHEVYQIIVNNSIIGYYSYFIEENNHATLDNLFISPQYIGKGYGKILMNDFLDKMKESNIKTIILEADPNAEKFYESFNFIKTGQIETSIKDRFLPIMELKL
ncbi:GNAT family N-acetyltransferase [Chryseobacterium sp. Ch-15]|uniref:GNAT family N-acetyltransferase n=1 Tax=Chryseobacterium muglaense TaxID=2893752 RepID=A0A9Q3YUD4_9FLAO|nr:GNAT family N-acetyltransferase [Chryseobacterium muglaense]MBD3906563.1 GNAT family N-acetyltransferase [Chryseobacterium muglaense]MCC9033565.1 GNAT family N-acetyltransferase [Chryseobacterium muglaense]MCM2556317.1 GNAT family N-acetyltransferase [Chryseobacterium muglaense]